eukprot:COSAG02_NODE_5457_length_4302_cov_2.364977_6_plen_38_part_00
MRVCTCECVSVGVGVGVGREAQHARAGTHEERKSGGA